MKLVSLYSTIKMMHGPINIRIAAYSVIIPKIHAYSMVGKNTGFLKW